MPLTFVADYTSTSFAKDIGKAFDAAGQGVVRVQRRGEVFVLLRAQQLEAMVQEADEQRPVTLEQMVSGYDAADIKRSSAEWLSDAPQGREVL